MISRNKITYPDHYALILKFKNIPLKPKKRIAGPKYSTWNTNKVDGWDKYREATEDNPKLEEIGNEPIDDATKAMKKINKELDKCKFLAFGKVTVKTTPVVNKEVDELFKKKSVILNQKDDIDDGD